MLTPTAEREGASIPLRERAGGVAGGAECDAEGGCGHVTTLADLVEIGTRVICRSMRIANTAIGAAERERIHGDATAAQAM